MKTQYERKKHLMKYDNQEILEWNIWENNSEKEAKKTLLKRGM
jgi:hypothetical protein